MPILIQIVGFVAMALTITAYQYKKRVHILLSQYSGNILWCVHYFLLGQYTGLVMNFLNVIRGIIFSIDKKWAKSKIWIFVFCGASIVSGILTFSEWYSVLPIFGTVIATISLYIKQENLLRKVYVISVPFWIVYNFLANSISGTLSSLFTLVSLIVAIIRYDIKAKKDKAIENQKNSTPENGNTAKIETAISSNEIENNIQSTDINQDSLDNSQKTK